MIDTVKKLVMEQLGDMLRLGAEEVTQEEYERRVEICRACPHLGQVRPVPLLEVEGCTICGCPTATKPRFKILPRQSGKEGTPLTAKEIAFIQLKIRTGQEWQLEKETIICPDSENRWAL